MKSTNIPVNLTKKQYLTIKNLFHATSKKATSPLRCVYYHAQKKQVVACDGHLIRWEKMDLGENDIFFESHYFSYPKSSLKSLFPHEPITREFTIEQPENISPYPNYESALPPEKYMCPEDASAPALDPKKLNQFMKSVTDEYVAYIIIPTNSVTSGIYVYGVTPGSDTQDEKIIGLIMPVSCEESRENLSTKLPSTKEKKQ